MSSRKPCEGCGGEKRPGSGNRYCQACHDLRGDATSQHHREIRRRSAAKRREAAREAGLVKRRTVRDPGDGTWWCPRCANYLPKRAFPKRANGSQPPYCTLCQRTYMAERRLLKDYGLTWEEYNELLEAQDGRCAICEGKPRRNALAVDHNHQTGEIRGLLCSKCNHRLLGSAGDSAERLRKAADYLERYPAREVLGGPRIAPKEVRRRVRDTDPSDP